MQQFQVPQYINIEDRIIGPLTMKQFLYLLGGAAAILLAWFFLNPFFFSVIAVPVALFSGSMAFLTIGGRPFPTVLFNGINFYLKPRLYIWKRAPNKKMATPKPLEINEKQLKTPSLTESKLSDLSWSLDIKEKIGR
ncbi:MAG: PrgI family protein [bacterium]|nr:PrgI family protein [bacterium]